MDEKKLRELIAKHEYVIGACLCGEYKMPPYTKADMDKYPFPRDIRWALWAKHFAKAIEAALAESGAGQAQTKEEIIAKLRSRWSGEVSSTRVHAWAEAIDYLQPAAAKEKSVVVTTVTSSYSTSNGPSYETHWCSCGDGFPSVAAYQEHVRMVHEDDAAPASGTQPETIGGCEAQLQKDIASAINRVSAENGSNTPDFILAEFLTECLSAWNRASRAREKWYGKSLSIGGNGAAPAGHVELSEEQVRVAINQSLQPALAREVVSIEKLTKLLNALLRASQAGSQVSGATSAAKDEQ